MSNEEKKMAVMDAWLAAVAEEIGAPIDVIRTHRDELLNLVSTIAHGPSRPGAPMTMFLLGMCAAQESDVSALTAKVSDLAQRYTPAE
ncbi:DUF6457 domain-containing protein [Trueperella sp. LYQ143]|uniref:DUF6457 domain-containing protein n=1 Tax=unclassified Trueperella TaxID=2630174 RepID=UPI003982FCFD